MTIAERCVRAYWIFSFAIKLVRELAVAELLEIPSRSLYPSLSPFVLNGSPRETRAAFVLLENSPTVMGENISLSRIVTERMSALSDALPSNTKARSLPSSKIARKWG